MGKWFSEVVFQSQIFLQGKIHDQAAALPILRNIRDSFQGSFADGVIGDIDSIQKNTTWSCLLNSCNRICNLNLTIAGYSGNGKYFSAVDRKGYIFYYFKMILIFYSEILYL